MPDAKLLVLDANILIRAVLGRRVRAILVEYGGVARFVAPDSAFTEAEEHLPTVLAKRRTPVANGLAVLSAMNKVVQPIGRDTYSAFERIAKRRLARRDVEDWPVLATALVFDCPIWTEDADFFGAGVPTWTTDRVEMYLENTVS
ncbi:MAG: PIN domain-containing protein [Terracidiphilus sp.]